MNRTDFYGELVTKKTIRELSSLRGKVSGLFVAEIKDAIRGLAKEERYTILTIPQYELSKRTSNTDCNRFFSFRTTEEDEIFGKLIDLVYKEITGYVNDKTTTSSKSLVEVLVKGVVSPRRYYVSELETSNLFNCLTNKYDIKITVNVIASPLFIKFDEAKKYLDEVTFGEPEGSGCNICMVDEEMETDGERMGLWCVPVHSLTHQVVYHMINESGKVVDE